MGDEGAVTKQYDKVNNMIPAVQAAVCGLAVGFARGLARQLSWVAASVVFRWAVGLLLY